MSKEKQRPAMTDEQIEAGLTACTSMKEIGCPKCPYKEYQKSCLCLWMLMTDTLAYIERLKTAKR